MLSRCPKSYSDALRLTQIVLCGASCVWVSILTFGNLTDYGSNFEFLSHVFAMDTTYPGNHLMYRSVTNPIIVTAFYWLTILGEIQTSILFGVATRALWVARKDSPEAFQKAKRHAVMATLSGFVVWYIGYMVIGGEWFAMWQSATWNGQQGAFRDYASLLIILLVILKKDEV